MFPVSDVIPSKTTPYVTIAIITVLVLLIIAVIVSKFR